MPTLNRSTADKMSMRFYSRKMKWRIERVNHHFDLPEYFAPMLEGRTHARVADLGAGPISMTGQTWPGCEIDLVASDAMADEYSKLWNNREPQIVPVEYQDMEALTYEDDSFDIVHCINAVDHTENPLYALNEMLRITKPGGWIYMRHGKNEAERMKYAGYHHWNLSEDGSLWTKSPAMSESVTKLTDIDSRFKTEMRTEVSNTPYPSEPMVVTVLENV